MLRFSTSANAVGSDELLQPRGSAR